MYAAHDNIVISYEVNLAKQTIFLYTEERTQLHVKNIVLKFSDVLAHKFENEIHGSVILDICEEDIASFVKDNINLLERKDGCSWPCFYNTIAELDKKLMNERYRYFLITPSYGFSGWVISKQYNVMTKD